jgi:hypothetical protein
MLPKSSKFAPLARLPKRTKAFRIVPDERGDRPIRIPDAEDEARFSAEAPINEANGLKMLNLINSAEIFVSFRMV